ncbi:MAG: HD domain-containing protein [Melioribacteraceae bacterium]|nr:HD domain-containing protein [Melioribacteraceae bacterium]
MLHQTGLGKLGVGENVNHFLLVSKMEMKTARNNKNYLSMELRDQSLSLQAKMWDNFDDVVNTISEGDIVKVEGKIDEYQGLLQIKINNINKAAGLDSVSMHDFLPKSDYDPDAMIKSLNKQIDSIENSYLRNLLRNVLKGDKLEKFTTVPAGKSWHHSYIHGLLEHTLEIIQICDLIAKFHKEVNRDLLISGAVLHDFGKTEELKIDSSFDYTDKGRLIGHIVIAANIVEKEIEKIDGFPENLKIQLIHLILSHQGKLEFASPVEPKTLEAIILYHADELSAKANAYKNAIKSDEFRTGNWTKYLPLANTALYIPPDSGNNEKETLFDI